MRSILAAGLALLAAVGFAEDRIYAGHYASGLAKWTVKGAHVYAGHYASGLAKWTTGTSSGLFHVYEGHYASGLSRFTYRDGHLYAGHYASGLAKFTYRDGHVYAGHYASGLAKFTVKDGHVYRGHYASGISAWTFKSQEEVPEGLLVFLVTQLLEPAADDAGATGSDASGSETAPGTTIVVVDRQPAEPSELETPVTPAAPESAVSVVWNRARTLRGVLEEDGAVVGSVEVKCGKVDRRGQARIAVSATPFLGRTRTYRGQKVAVQAGRADAVWTQDALRLEIGETSFRASFGTRGGMRSAVLGGAFTAGGHRLSVRRTGAGAELPGYALDAARLPSETAFVAEGSRWTFAKDEPSRIRLSYVPGKGVFKGSFKAVYAPVGDMSGRTRARTVTVKVAGLVADGAGVGAAASTRPVQAYSVAVE